MNFVDDLMRKKPTAHEKIKQNAPAIYIGTAIFI